MSCNDERVSVRDLNSIDVVAGDDIIHISDSSAPAGTQDKKGSIDDVKDYISSEFDITQMKADISQNETDISNNVLDITDLENTRLQSVVAGSDIGVDNTDPLNPVVSFNGEGSTLEANIGCLPVYVDNSTVSIPASSYAYSGDRKIRLDIAVQDVVLVGGVANTTYHLVQDSNSSVNFRESTVGGYTFTTSQATRVSGARDFTVSDIGAYMEIGNSLLVKITGFVSATVVDIKIIYSPLRYSDFIATTFENMLFHSHRRLMSIITDGVGDIRNFYYDEDDFIVFNNPFPIIFTAAGVWNLPQVPNISVEIDVSFGGYTANDYYASLFPTKVVTPTATANCSDLTGTSQSRGATSKRLFIENSSVRLYSTVVAGQWGITVNKYKDIRR